MRVCVCLRAQVVVENYGFTHTDVITVWAPTSAAMLLGTAFFGWTHRRKWRYGDIACFAFSPLPFAFVAVLLQTSTRDESGHYNTGWLALTG